MDILLSFIAGFIILIVFKFIERYFPKNYFYFSSLVIGSFTYKNLLISTLIPLFITLLFGLFIKSNNLVIYLIPGFLSSLLVVWPNIGSPEFIPNELVSKKQSLYAIYFLFIVLFTTFSYIGGILGKFIIFSPSILPSQQGLTDNIWTAIFIGIVSLIVRRFKKL